MNKFINSLSLTVLLTCFGLFPQLNAQVEDFESATGGATSFTTSSGSFTLSGLEVARAVGFGSGATDQFLDTGFGSSSTGGTISVNSSGMSFQISTLDGWTSHDQGGNEQAGVDVTFTGTLLAGGTIQETIEVNPTGFTGNDWDELLSLTPGIWSGQNLTSLQIDIENTGNAADYIAIDDINFSAITFPVEFTHFSVRPEGDDVILNWETGSELNNRGFEIQRTYDLRHFETVGFVEGNGTTESATAYQFSHANGMEGRNVSYRLRQIDFDGQHQYSQLVEVSMSGDLPFSFSAFPNPCVTDDLSISYYAREAGLVTLSLLTVEGRELSSITREALPGTNALRMSMNDIPAGLYLLEVTQAGQQLLQRVTRL